MSSARCLLRAIVAGGSLGGLNAALWLRDVGCDVDVFERTATSMDDRGAGIVLNPATVRYLATHDVMNLKNMSAATNWFRYMGPDGSILHEERRSYRFTSYSSLYRGMLQSFDQCRYHRGEELVGFEQGSFGLTVHFAGGRTERCDVLVCADGINSAGRGLLLPEIRPRYAGYVAWRGTVAEHELSTESFSSLQEAITYLVQPDSHALTYPIPNRDGEVEPGARLTNWLWYRNVCAGAELGDLLTGRSGEHFETSVPPGQVQKCHLLQFHEDAAALPPPFAEIISRTAEPFIQVVFDLEVPRMAFGRVCLIGDAAFTARPHAAAGTAKAAEDGWTLTQSLTTRDVDVVEALRHWEVGQLALGRQLVARSRDAGERLQHGRWSVGEALSFGLYRIGDSTFDD
jgi:2,6-dihydroxypyridine 3-monooxygenase